jgi:hypothetical protein
VQPDETDDQQDQPCRAVHHRPPGEIE